MKDGKSKLFPLLGIMAVIVVLIFIFKGGTSSIEDVKNIVIPGPHNVDVSVSTVLNKTMQSVQWTEEKIDDDLYYVTAMGYPITDLPFESTEFSSMIVKIVFMVEYTGDYVTVTIVEDCIGHYDNNAYALLSKAYVQMN